MSENVPMFPTELVFLFKSLSDEYQRKSFAANGRYIYSQKKDEEIYHVFYYTAKIIVELFDYMNESFPNIETVSVILPQEIDIVPEFIMEAVLDKIAQRQKDRMTDIFVNVNLLEELSVFGKEAARKLNDWLQAIMFIAIEEDVMEIVGNQLEQLRELIPMKNREE